jgi:hypothetical protein
MPAAAAAAAEIVRHGGCGKVVTCSSGGVHLQLPALHAAHGDLRRRSTNMDGTDMAAAAAAAAAGQLWSGSTAGDEQLPLWLPVATGRPPLQQLIESWLATQQQLPQPLHKGAADSHGSSSSTRMLQHGSQLRCSVYAMGPAALVADAQVLCGGIQGLHFVQKAYQL